MSPAESPELSALLDQIGLVCNCCKELVDNGMRIHQLSCPARLRAQAGEVMQRVMYRIQELEAVIYAVHGCAGTCAKCKELTAKVGGQGRSTVDADQASRQPEVKK